MTTVIKSFQVDKIKYPLQIFRCVNPEPNPTLTQFFKAELTILADDKIELLFGVQIVLEKEVSLGPKEHTLHGTVEALATITVEGKIEKPETKKDVPMLANMLAFMYPFIREKIHSGFACNATDIFLPSMNFYSFVDEVLNNVAIVDLRNKGESGLQKFI